MRLARLAPSVILLALAACGDAATPTCRVGADCASGVCNGDGSCAPVATTDVDASSDGADAATANDVGDDATGTAPGDGTTVADGDATGATTEDVTTVDADPRVCTPVDDDQVSAAEMPLRAGLYATFAIASDVAVDTGGEAAGDGRHWDLTGPYSGDSDVRVTLEPVSGAWWAPDFQGATYAAQLSTGEDYRGVFEVADDGLYLRGVVSPEDGLFETELTYDPPVTVLPFPLAEGDTFTTDTTATGLTMGVVSFVTESYESSVDAHGTLTTPYGTFDVLRVRTTLTRVVGAFVTTTYQTAFVSPCFGTVALVSASSAEDTDGTTQASEVRRLAP